MKTIRLGLLFGCLIALCQPAFAGDKKPTLPSSQTLDRRDKLGNTRIQTLMSDYGRATTLRSSVQKKKDDTAKGIIGKI